MNDWAQSGAEPKKEGAIERVRNARVTKKQGQMAVKNISLRERSDCSE